MPLNTTIAWTYAEIAVYALLAAVASILFSVQSRSVYMNYYGSKHNETRSIQVKNKDSETTHHTAHPTECSKCTISSSVVPVTNHRESTDCATRSPSGTLSNESPPKITMTPTVSYTCDHTDRQARTKSDKPSKRRYRLQMLTLCMFACYTACGISAVLFKLGIATFALCTPCGVQGSFYTAAKIMMYCVFIYRLHAIYSKSVFQFGTSTLVILGVTCVLFWTMMAMANIWTVTTVFVEIDGEIYCGCKTLMMLAAGILLFDTVISLLCCWLFVRPLRALNKLENNSDQELHDMVIKCTVLTFVAVISTMLSMIAIVMFYLTGLVALDAIVNCVCVFLFDSDYDAHYKVLCCGARRCVCGRCAKK
eukprot:36943_1